MSGTSGLRLRMMTLALSLAIMFAACQAAASPANSTTTSSPISAAPSARPTPVPPVALGKITLTETGCTWAGSPGTIRAGRVTIELVNDTDGYGLFLLHRLHAGKTWADGEVLIAAIQDALQTGAEWPPAVSEAIVEAGAEAGEATSLAANATGGTYGVVCSGSASRSDGDILTVFLVGPLTVTL